MTSLFVLQCPAATIIGVPTAQVAFQTGIGVTRQRGNSALLNSLVKAVYTNDRSRSVYVVPVSDKPSAFNARLHILLSLHDILLGVVVVSPSRL